MQPNELPVSLLTQRSDCAAFIFGISFTFLHFLVEMSEASRISPDLSEMQLQGAPSAPYVKLKNTYVVGNAGA